MCRRELQFLSDPGSEDRAGTEPALLSPDERERSERRPVQDRIDASRNPELAEPGRPAGARMRGRGMVKACGLTALGARPRARWDLPAPFAGTSDGENHVISRLRHSEMSDVRENR